MTEEIIMNELESEILRLKQENDNFETLAKSLYKRIEELEKENEALAFRERLYKDDYEASEQENEELKVYIKNLQERKDRYYLQVLEYERQVNDWINFYIKVRDIISGNYEMLDSQGLQDLRQIISEVEK